MEEYLLVVSDKRAKTILKDRLKPTKERKKPFLNALDGIFRSTSSCRVVHVTIYRMSIIMVTVVPPTLANLGGNLCFFDEVCSYTILQSTLLVVRPKEAYLTQLNLKRTFLLFYKSNKTKVQIT
jgi:hypothetical protein